MKINNISKWFLSGAILATMAGCSENSWNNDELEGFETPVITNVKTVQDTLTTSAIKKLALMKKNREIATAAGQLNELLAVAEQGYFTSTITPEIYAPAYLDSIGNLKNSKIYQLDNNSTVQLTFPTSIDLPSELTKIPTAPTFTVTEAQYQEVYGSDTNFAEAFSPSKPASKNLPTILAAEYPDAVKGDYVIATYNVASQNPVFGGAGNTPDVPQFQLSNVIASAKVDDNITVNGLITALCAQGYILTDNSGSMLVYAGRNFVMGNYNIGDQVVASGIVYSNNGGKQFNALNDDFSESIEGNQFYTYPTAVNFGATELAEAIETFNGGKTSGACAVYATIKGKVKQSGTYFNIIIDGDDTNDMSLYQAPSSITSQLKDGLEVNITGYVCSRSGSKAPFHVNILATEFNGTVIAPQATAKSRAAVSRAGVDLAYSTETTVWTFNGSRWEAPADILVLNQEDYTAMGLKYASLSAAQASTYLPMYLKSKFPYALEENTKYVVYNFYNGSETLNNFVSRAIFDGTNWNLNTINYEMNQFVRAPKQGGGYMWIYDPSVYITLPAGRGASSADFWQACVDWVYENVDVPEFNSTDIKSGVGYVTSYGNNDYYSGVSAYQCNVDLRPASARAQVPSVYGSMSDEEVVSTMKKHFEEDVMPAVLHELYPAAEPGKNVNQYYVINFVMYDGSSHNETIRYLVTATGVFEFVDCSWNDEE